MRRIPSNTGLLVLSCLLLARHATAEEPAAGSTGISRSPTPEQIQADFAAMETQIFALYPAPYRTQGGSRMR